MRIALDPEVQAFVDRAIDTDLYPSPTAMVRAGLMLLEARDRETARLRLAVEHALSRGGENDQASVDAAVAAALQELRQHA